MCWDVCCVHCGIVAVIKVESIKVDLCGPVCPHASCPTGLSSYTHCMEAERGQAQGNGVAHGCVLYELHMMINCTHICMPCCHHYRRPWSRGFPYNPRLMHAQSPAWLYTYVSADLRGVVCLSAGTIVSSECILYAKGIMAEIHADWMGRVSYEIRLRPASLSAMVQAGCEVVSSLRSGWQRSAGSKALSTTTAQHHFHCPYKVANICLAG